MLGPARRSVAGGEHAIFEATHGTAPKYAGQDVVNPSSVILCGSMMFHYMGWEEVSQLIGAGISETIRQKCVTSDLHRLMEGAVKVKTSELAAAIVGNMALPAAA
ncbi:MAG: hypothetical protein LAO04_21260 [Acidobacteriia bacterium]|nr:hypothetical protein [Terriglobia bacterium]